MYDEPTRRRFLAALGSGTAAALAGCGGKSIDDDPNPYDYTFVPGDELARSIPEYEDEDIQTETTVSFDGFIQYTDHGTLRQYTATPDDTQNTFTVAEETDGPLYELFGEQLDEPAHEDVALNLYGFVDGLVTESFEDHAFIVEDATRVGQGETNDG